MTDIWILKACRSSTSRLVSTPPSGDTVVYCEFLNALELYMADYFGGRAREIPFPIAQLKVTREDFDADFFDWNGRLLVSERMRQVMGLDSSTARFFEVDASQSAPLPRSKNYEIMEPAATEDVADPIKSAYDVLQLGSNIHSKPINNVRVSRSIRARHQKGAERAFIRKYHWMRSAPYRRPTRIEAIRIVKRDGVEPGHELFYDQFFHRHLFCTEALALRILKAGCTGVRFVDPSRLGYGVNPRYRTLSGVEEHVRWDLANVVETTEIIQRID